MKTYVADNVHLTRACSDRQRTHFHIYICVDGRHRALGLADFVALAGGPFGPGGIDLSCRLDPPPRLALVLRRAARVFRLPSLAPFLRMDKRV